MKRTCKFIILPFIFVLALLAVFAISQPVHAQDELPPTEPVPVVDPAAVGSDPAPVEVPPEPEVALLTEAGEPIAVDSAEAAALPADVDPWFKVGTTTYTFTVADCDPGLPVVACPQPLQAAVNYIQAHGTIPSDGYIHVDAGVIPNQKVDINGSNTYENSIKGIVGHVDPATFEPDAILSYTDTTGGGSYIRVVNKTNGFLLSGLDISGNSAYVSPWGIAAFNNNVGTITLKDLTLNNGWVSGNGVLVYSQNGSVSLTNIKSNHNVGSGAWIDNTLGTTGVTIINSAFDENQGNGVTYAAAGIRIQTKGPVVVTGIDASYNDGLYPGLWIQGGTTVTIKNALVSENTGGGGIRIENAAGAVTLTNTYANGNLNTGIYIRNKGAITMTDVFANGNSGVGARGADLDNTTSTSSVGVTITNGQFSGNYTSGLWIVTKYNITLTNVSAEGNNSIGGSYGAYLDNLAGTGSVKVTNPPSTEYFMLPGFSSNHDRGLDIHTRGTVTLTNVNIFSNQEEGMYVWQDFNKGVTMTNCRVDGNGTVSAVAGILINSLGPIVINGGHANGNNGFGVWAHNEAAPDAAPKPVTITNFEASGNHGFGIRVESKGAIKLTNVIANGTHGALESSISLNNAFLSAGVTLSKVAANGNIYNGIKILTNGIAILSNIVADGNQRNGLYIDQSSATLFPTVSITTAELSGNTNFGSGLAIFGRGAITLKDIKADGNDWTGAYVENVTGNVSVLATSSGGNSFSSNTGHDGIDINTHGTVVVNKVTANGNTGATGVFIYCSLSHAGNVTVTGSTFAGNGTGLYIDTLGTVILTDVTSVASSTNGIHVDATTDTTGTKPVTLTRVTLLGNTAHGILVDTYGAITANTIKASGNGSGVGDEGVELNNTYGAFLTPKGITILGSYGTNNVSGNSGDGLLLLTKGNVSITKVIANGNDGVGVNINNYQAGLGKGTVIISSTTANDNTYQGIRIDATNNAVTLTGVTVVGNGLGNFCSGVYISSSHNHNLTVSNSFFTGNDYAGITATIGTGVFTITSSYYLGNDISLFGVPDLEIYH